MTSVLPMTLVYDVATMSRTPFRTVVFAAGLTLLAAGAWIWQLAHGESANGLVIWASGAAAIMWLVAAGTEYEKRLISRKQPLVIEGPVADVWEDRVKRAGRSNDYWDWQGFRIAHVAFSYVRNTDQNYFNNASSYRIDLVAGVWLRVHYLESRKGDRVRRCIVRVERLESHAPERHS